MIFGLVTSMGQRKNSEFPWGSEPQTFGFHAPMLLLSHRDSRVSKAHCKEKTPFSTSLSSSKLTIFLILFPKYDTNELKTYHLSYSISKTWQKRAQNLPSFLFYFQNITLTSSKLTIFLILFPKHDANELKTYHLPYSIYKTWH